MEIWGKDNVLELSKDQKCVLRKKKANRPTVRFEKENKPHMFHNLEASNAICPGVICFIATFKSRLFSFLLFN